MAAPHVLLLVHWTMQMSLPFASVAQQPLLALHVCVPLQQS